MSLFDAATTSAQVIAKDHVRAFEITKENLARILDGSDRLALQIFRAFVGTLNQRLRDTSQKKVASN